MKRCPKCNRTFSTETQKFCTHDGAPLVTAESHQGETVRIDSAQIEGLDNAPTRAISRDLTSPTTGPFDPYKTILAPAEEKKQVSSAGEPDPFKTVAGWQEGTRGTGGRDTQELVSPAPTSTSLPQGPTTSVPSPTPFEPTPSAPLSEPPPPPSSSSAPLPPGPATMPSVALPEPQTTPSSSSAPLPPGSATLPSVPLTPAPGAVAPSAPLLAPQPAMAGSAQAIQRPVKKSKLPLVLGVLAVLLLLGIGGVAAAYFLVIKPRLEKQTVIKKREPRPQPSVALTPTPQTTPVDLGKTENEPPPYSPPSNAVEFVNSKKNLDGKLADHYVDFSFYYPNYWKKDPTAGVPGASNFAKVERRLPPDFTQENFAVGWYSSAGSAEADASVFHTLVENLSSQFKKSFPEYKKVSEGDTKVGVYKGYEFRFESVSKNTVNGDVNVWGRVVLLPPANGGNNGVTLLMLTTSLAPELKNIDDVGEKGDLPMLLQSFRFGK